LLVLVIATSISACGGGGGSSGIKSTPLSASAPRPATQYPSVLTLTLDDTLSGWAVGYTTDYTNQALGEVPGGSASGRISGSASGVQALTLTVNGIGGASFSEQFSAADLTTSTPVPGTSARLLSGSKTATDGSVRTLTILDAPSSSLNYTVLGAWEYAPIAGATSTNAAWFAFGPATRPTDIPLTGTATYNGLMVGRYADGAAIWTVGATASAGADFANRSVIFNTSNTQLNNQTGTLAAPTLNLSGTLSYAAGANNVTGALTTPAGLTGTANAQFYGPAAAELAGAFFVGDGASTKQMTGSFGVKR
jgi:hypothetical protein